MAVSFTYDREKALAAVLYLASRPKDVPDLDKYKVGKLLFLAEKYHVVRYGRPIFGDHYRALPWGPVPQCTLDMLHVVVEPDQTARAAAAGSFQGVQAFLDSIDADFRFRYPRLSARTAPDMEVLSESDVEALEHVIERHGGKTFGELKALTHEMPTYAKAWEGRGEGLDAASMSYEDFFEEEPDAVEGALEEMLENDALSKL